MDEEVSIDWSCCISTIKHMIDKRLPGKASPGMVCGGPQLLKEVGQALLDAYDEYTTGE